MTIRNTWGIMEETVELARARAQKNTCRIPPCGPIRCDQLINNAIAEVPPDGSINVRGSIDPAGTSVHLSVIDTGKGMLSEVRGSLFTYRAISRKVDGTGLGTKIVKDVVSHHGGTITVQIEPGKGMVFYITLSLEGSPPHSGRASG